MKFVLISPKNRTVYNFRGDLLREIVRRGYDVTVVGPNHDDEALITELGVTFSVIPLNKSGINPMADIKYYRALKRLLRREKPDVVLGYTIKPVVYGAMAAKKARVGRICVMVTGVGYTFIARTWKAKCIRAVVTRLYRRGFRRADAVIFQNQDDKKEFVGRKLLKEDKCVVVHGSGVNMERFSPAPFPERITFFMLARIMRSKGVMEYLQAARLVKSRHPKARCVLLGAVEDMQDSLRWEEVKPYVDGGIVEVFGETRDVTPYFRACSVFVLPSYREGTPRTVLEAMAMGRPVITTDAPGCRETVIDGETGFLVPVRNPEAVAEKMLWFMEHSDRIAPMGAAGYRYCREKFDVSKVNRDMLDFLQIEGND